MRHLMIVAGVILAGCGGAPASGPGQLASEDSCGAADHAKLIGMGAAAALTVPQPKRVYRTDEAITQDYAPGRINVILDETDTIIEIRCG